MSDLLILLCNICCALFTLILSVRSMILGDRKW